MVKQNLTKKDIVIELGKKGVIVARGAKNSMDELKLQANRYNVPVSIEVPEVIEGWEGKPKGLKQVLWERGLLDVSKIVDYSVSGKKMDDGDIDLSFSFRGIMEGCFDFENEETQLQSLGSALGIIVDRTPKFHAELAGEGIEYSWGYSKGLYRGKPFSRKKKKESFKELVRECTNAEALNPERVRKFSARARAYIMTYHYFANQTVNVDQDEDNVGMEFMDIEKMMKKFKTHRCAFDFDKGFVMS